MRKLFILFTFLSVSLMGFAATQYCGETSSNANFTFSLMNVSGNTYRIQFDAVGDANEKITSINLVNIGVNQTGGAGMAFPAGDWVVTPDRAYVDFTTASGSSVPTNFYTWAIFFGRAGGGENAINSGTPSDVDWTATCGGGGGSGLTDPQLSLNETAVTLDATVPEIFSIIATQLGDGAISYESSNSGIASVDNTGTVTAVGRGTATITVRTAETATYAADSETLTVTVNGPINWATEPWIGNGSGDAANTEKWKMAEHGYVNIQTPGWATETGIYATFSAPIVYCSLGEGNYAVDGAGLCMYLSAFTAEVTEVLVIGNHVQSIFYVYKDGASGTANLNDIVPASVSDVNFALETNGGWASATSGNAWEGNDNNNGTRWVTPNGVDPQIWTLDLGRRRIFNTVQIRWEGAYAKTFTIQVSNDAETWTTVKTVTDQVLEGFPYEQTLEFAEQTARYVRFNGTARGTGYGYSFWEFRVLLPGVSVLTSIDLTAASALAEVGGAGVALTATPKDQNGQVMAETISYEITPAAAGHMSGNTYIPDQNGTATIRAYSGEVYSPAVTVRGYSGSNLALSTNISTDNKVVDQSEVTGDATSAFYAVDGNKGSVWQACRDLEDNKSNAVFTSFFTLDLGSLYDVNLIAIWFDGAASDEYAIDFSEDNSTWKSGFSISQSVGNYTHQKYLMESDLSNNTKLRYVRFTTTKASTTAGWGLKIFEFEVYGIEWVNSGDTEAPVMVSASEVSKTYDQVVIAVSATDNDEVVKYHVVDATNGIDANLTPSAGNITITGLTHGTSYNFTITAKDAAGNESENSKVVAVSIPFNSSINLALNQPVVAGYTPENAGEVPTMANDGNLGSPWTTYNNQPMDVQWWSVDLGNLYQLSAVELFWADRSDHYLIQVAQTEPADYSDDSQWITALEVDETQTTGNAEENKNHYALNAPARYVRFKAVTKAGTFLKLWEFRVFGSGRATADAEKPTMSSASLVSNTDSHAIISVSASDGEGSGIASYHVVDADNSFDANFAAEGGNITVTGLAGGTSYNFTITAIDFFGNESANSKSVSVNTTAHYTEPQAACTAPEWDAALVKAIYSPTYSADCNFANWAGCTAYTADTYGKKFEVGAECWGFGLDGFTLNCVTMQKLHADIWVADDASLRLVPIYGGTGLTTDDSHGKMVNLEGQTWNSIDLTLASDFAGLNLSSIFQFKIDNANGLTFWIGNLYFYRESAIVDNEDPVIVSASVTEESFTSVKITVQATDDSGAVNFSVKNGDTEVATAAAASGEEKVIIVNGLASGTHFNLTVIASDEAGNETSSSPLSATTKLLPPPAPVPTEQSADVKSLFSDVYSPIVAVENYCEWWWESPTVHTDLSVGAGDKVLYYDNNHQAGASFGWAWNAANKVDFGGFQMLHISIYPTQAGTIEIYPVVAGVTTNKISQALVANKWNEVVLNYTDKEFAPMNQIGFINFYDLGSFFIDNVYFAKSPDLSRDASTGDDWMAPGELGTICIPNGAIAKGGDIYELVGKNSEGKIVFATVPNNVMEPGKPYLFEAKSNAMNFYYTAETEAAAPVNTGAMKGTFSEITLTGDDLENVYYFAGRALWSCVDLTTTGLHVSANRAYVKLDEVEDITPSPAPGRRYITMGVNGKDAATGFDQLNASEAPVKMIIDGQLFILCGEKLYDATGRLVK